VALRLITPASGILGRLLESGYRPCWARAIVTALGHERAPRQVPRHIRGTTVCDDWHDVSTRAPASIFPPEWACGGSGRCAPPEIAEQLRDRTGPERLVPAPPDRRTERNPCVLTDSRVRYSLQSSLPRN
jgi:hypothetical protein